MKINFKPCLQRIFRSRTKSFAGKSRARLLYNEHLLPAALTVYNRQIYIANMNRNTIDLYTGHTLTVLHDGVSHVTNLAVAHTQINKGGRFVCFVKKIPKWLDYLVLFNSYELTQCSYL